MFDSPAFILGVLPAAAIVIAVIVGRESRKRAGQSSLLLWALAAVLFVPIVLIEWLLLWPLGASLAYAPSVVGNIIVPAVALAIGVFIAYRLAGLVSSWRTKDGGLKP